MLHCVLRVELAKEVGCATVARQWRLAGASWPAAEFCTISSPRPVLWFLSSADFLVAEEPDRRSEDGAGNEKR